jgi:predicted N-acyltransferase
MLRAEFHQSITEIDACTWTGLFQSENPFLRYEFIAAMEESGCVCEASGWAPVHLLVYSDDEPIAVAPLYEKHHSYGEFVFDWGWAEAYERNGLSYYPKLLTAIPFTPSAGPRIGISKKAEPEKVIPFLVKSILSKAREKGHSGWHLLFPPQDLLSNPEQIEELDLLCRQDVQFHWFNRGYENFDGFLNSLRASRRKNLKRERRSVAESGISLERKTGESITPEEWAAFYRCYCHTYLKRSGHPGYLNREFFDQLLATMPDSLMLVVARDESDAVIACSLFLFDRDCLFGRYWGALLDIPFLHFEACFYQGIEFCIENDIREFDPGTQGEHKLLRGFEPVKTRSLHWIADHRFRDAIATHLADEGKRTEAYGEQASEFLPYKKGSQST